MTKWVRDLKNFPMIMMPILYHYMVALSLLLDPNAHMATPINMIYSINLLPMTLLPFLFLLAPTLAVVGFYTARRIITVVCLVPLQLLLLIAAGGSFKAIWLGEFADGTHRAHSFIAADQIPIILMAIFYSWAMILIFKHGENGA